MMPTNSNDHSNHSTFLDSVPLEASAPLEASVPLDFRDEVRLAGPGTDRPVARPLANTPQPQPQETVIEHDRGDQPIPAVDAPMLERNRQEDLSLRQRASLATPKIVEEEVVQLLEERLVVDRTRRKVGEVIVRKEIETQMIEVPVRREKLIIEQIGSETKQLATIDLGQPTLEDNEANPVTLQPAVSGEFTSIKAAIQFLETIASTQPALEGQALQVKVLVENADHKQLYRQQLDRPSDHCI